jgi:hypothetical protein
MGKKTETLRTGGAKIGVKSKAIPSHNMLSLDPPILQMTPAQTLEEVYRTLQPTPLVSSEELAAFYKGEVNDLRGGDKMQRMKQSLQRAYRDRLFFKAFFMGHQGVGKSTELSRLSENVRNEFSIIRFSAMKTLNPSTFQPLDVVLVMMAEVARCTSLPIDQGGAGQTPPEARLREILDWFATEKETIEQAQSSMISLDGGGGLKADSLWGKVTGLFATVKGELKFNGNRKSEIIKHRVDRLDLLIEVANRLLDDCNDLLRTATNKEWLFIGEDFDRGGIPTARLEELFLTYGNIFKDLRTHLIFSLPISLCYSEKSPQLPFALDRRFILPDTPIFQLDKLPNQMGRAALVKVLEARLKPDLFEPDQMMRLIVASGGNLRDLFALVNYAADTAALRAVDQIAARDAEEAIVNLRSDYERRLGQSPYDTQNISYPEKAARLVKIYEGDYDALITDGVIHSLLSARAVQEFNGQRWFGVHPLVVDILVKQGRIQRPATGPVPGGIE